MNIYLMRHGVANNPYMDPEQGLSPAGRDGVQKTADYIKKEDISFDVIISSPKTRAAQTADIVARTVEYPVENIIRTDTLKPNSAPIDAMRFLAKHSKCASVLAVGHLPSMPALSAMLIGSATAIPFPNAILYRVNADTIPPTSAELTQLFSPE